MVDIIFAYLYENRVMDNDPGKESAITINRLSSSFSCHTINENFKDVLN